jgi:hypothetical protein
MKTVVKDHTNESKFYLIEIPLIISTSFFSLNFALYAKSSMPRIVKMIMKRKRTIVNVLTSTRVLQVVLNMK